MKASNEAAGSGRASSPQEFTVQRDGGRPFAFSGFCLAEAAMPGRFLDGVYRAAVYKTVGGKFITRLSKHDDQVVAAMMGMSPNVTFADLIDEDAPADKPKERTGVFAKAGVFDTLDAALGWFRPGRLTDSIRKQLGLDEPIRID
jgi:hypothetical protein